jgi:hypothetical protein
VKKLIDSTTPIVFVQYPVGAGGWFLTALLYSAFNPSETIKHNLWGSGHANTKIMSLNNFYAISLTETYQSILYQTTTTTSLEQIEYVRNTLLMDSHCEEHSVQPISIHCQDINIFLQAFPNSKVIQIAIEDRHVPMCAFKFIHKVLQMNLVYFEKICGDYSKDFQEEKRHLEQVDLKSLAWINQLIAQSNIKTPVLDEFDTRVLTIDYDQYMLEADAYDLLDYIGKFLQADWADSVKYQLADELALYRTMQPPYPHSTS